MLQMPLFEEACSLLLRQKRAVIIVVHGRRTADRSVDRADPTPKWGLFGRRS